MHKSVERGMIMKLKLKENVIYKGIIYLENHYIEEVTVEDLAEMCNISES